MAITNPERLPALHGIILYTVAITMPPKAGIPAIIQSARAVTWPSLQARKAAGECSKKFSVVLSVIHNTDNALLHQLAHDFVANSHDTALPAQNAAATTTDASTLLIWHSINPQAAHHLLPCALLSMHIKSVCLSACSRQLYSAQGEVYDCPKMLLPPFALPSSTLPFPPQFPIPTRK